MAKNSFVAEATFNSWIRFKESQLCIPINVMSCKGIFLLVTTKRHIYRKHEYSGILTVYLDKHFNVWARVSDLRLYPSHFCLI